MAKPLWRFDEIVAACGAPLDGTTEAEAGNIVEASGISIDSRTLQPGDLFVAIDGDRSDGHRYAGAAFEAGAVGAIVRKDFQRDGRHGTLFRVDNTLEALEALARAARTRMSGPVIAITGSAGKTGTKEALHLALAPSGTTHASEKSYNNQWGVPLSLARMPAETAYGIFEAGMNHAGEITPLSQMIRPHIAIITLVAPVHIGFFDSEEAIAEAKVEIFAGLEPQGVALLNRDNKHFQLLAARAEAAGARILGFGSDREADIRLVELVLENDSSLVSASVCGAPLRYRIGAAGAHHVMNSLAVLGAVHAAGGDIAAAGKALSGVRAQKGRGACTRYPLAGGAITIIDESYNANPASVGAALETLAQMPRTEYPRRVIVLGDMLELGAHSEALHRGLAEPVVNAGVDKVFACGPIMSTLYEALPIDLKGGYAEISEDLAPLVIEALKPGDAVMIKGSLGSRMSVVVDALTAHLRKLPSRDQNIKTQAEG